MCKWSVQTQGEHTVVEGTVRAKVQRVTSDGDLSSVDRKEATHPILAMQKQSRHECVLGAMRGDQNLPVRAGCSLTGKGILS